MSTALLGHATTLAATTTWLMFIGLFFATQDQPGRQLLMRYRNYVERRLRFLRHRFSPWRIISVQMLGCLAFLGWAMANGSALPLAFVPLVLLAPKVQLERLVAKRVTEVEELTEPWLNAIANALKASPSLGEAILASVPLMPNPMSEEVDLLVKEYELGTSLDKALEQFAERFGSRTLSGAVLALKVARNSGGNLTETLENAATALRELARLEGVVRTKTAEGKAQAFVIGAIPLPMVVGIYMLDNHFFDPLIGTFKGHLVVGAAGVLWVLAILLSSKILAVDI